LLLNMGSLPLPTQTLTPDDIPPGPLSEDDLRQRWNREADKYNQWESLDSCEQLAWAQALAIRADRHAAALKPKPAEQRPTDEDLYDLAAEFNGDPVPAMRGALELWGNPLQGAPATGENPAAAPAPVPETPAEALAARPLLERVAKLGDVIGRQTVAQVQELAAQAAEWLRENPPGQPVAIDPRACPTPGAYSCVEPTSQAPEDLATDQLMAANLSALLVEECGLHSPGSSTHDLLQRVAAMLVNYGLPARPVTPPAPEPVAWCRSDEFVNSMNRGGSFNGWRDPGAGANKCDMRLYAIPLPAPEPVTECPNCGYEGEMVPATQAGEGEA
jgi:hypothetical protein